MLIETKKNFTESPHEENNTRRMEKYNLKYMVYNIDYFFFFGNYAMYMLVSF